VREVGGRKKVKMSFLWGTSREQTIVLFEKGSMYSRSSTSIVHTGRRVGQGEKLEEGPKKIVGWGVGRMEEPFSREGNNFGAGVTEGDIPSNVFCGTNMRMIYFRSRE